MGGRSSKIRRDLALPLPVGQDVPLQGRVKECAGLIEPGNRLLDIGCSSGWVAPLAVNKGFKAYVGIDRAIVGTQPSRPEMTFVEGSVLNLPFSENAFDAVCMFDVLEHLPRGTETKALAEASRVLAPNGKFYFSTPHASWVHTPLDPVWCFGHRHYRRQTIRRLFRSAGLTVDRIFVAGGVVEGLDHLRLLFYKHLLHRPLPPIRIVSQLIETSHGKDRRVGMTIFAIGSRRGSLGLD